MKFKEISLKPHYCADCGHHDDEHGEEGCAKCSCETYAPKKYRSKPLDASDSDKSTDMDI